MQKFEHKSLIDGTIGTSRLVLVRQGKRAIMVRAIDILCIYLLNAHSSLFIFF